MRTLCIDVGGSGIKAGIVDEAGTPESEQVRVPTPRPATPASVLAAIELLVAPLGDFDRVGVGFPGVVVDDITLTAPNLDDGWAGFRLGDALASRYDQPVRVANDAEVQGLAVIRERGVEMILTLGTGMGSGLYVDGRLVPNLELGHHPFGNRKGETYEQRIRESTRKKIGNKRWSKRVREVALQLAPIFNYRVLYLGGGNAKRLSREGFSDDVVFVDNVAGLLGCVKLFR